MSPDNTHEEFHTESPATLVLGIIDDLEQLVKLQFRLTKGEIEDEINKRVSVMGTFLAGVGMVFVALTVLCLGAVHLVHWLTINPTATESPLPLWVCHLIVGSVVGLGGLLIAYVSCIRLEKCAAADQR